MRRKSENKLKKSTQERAELKYSSVTKPLSRMHKTQLSFLSIPGTGNKKGRGLCKCASLCAKTKATQVKSDIRDERNAKAKGIQDSILEKSGPQS